MTIERASWQRQARWSPSTRRDEEWYRSTFDIDSTERVLDLGSGKSPFAPQNVVRTDYKYLYRAPQQGVNVACLFQELPFADESFDRVITSWALFYVRKGRVQATDEVLRVLKVGGKFQDFPVGDTEASDAFLENNKGKLSLDRMGSETLPRHPGRYALASTFEGILSMGVDNVNGVANLALDGAGVVLDAIWAKRRVFPELRLTVVKDASLRDPAQREAVAKALNSVFAL